MKANDPLVSICIPAYNCAPYIEDTLHCLCVQSYPNLEIIIVNDGSTDETAVKIRDYPDPRVKLFDLANRGAASARNTAYNHAGGDYIVFFDADDYIQPDFLQSQVTKINYRENVVVLSDWGRFYDKDLNRLGKEKKQFQEMCLEDWINYYWYHANPMTNPGRALIPKKVIEAAGKWKETLSLNDDLEFFTRIFLNTNAIVFNHEALFYYRSGIKGLSAKQGADAYLSLYDSVKLSTGIVLKKWPGRPDIRRSCANLWQSFVYEVYPREKQLIAAAEADIRNLGGTSLAFPAGGYTKFLASVIGWKMTKILKRIVVYG